MKTRPILIVAAATAVALAACSARRVQARDCPGGVAATVRNHWAHAIDVYADRRGGGLILGEVRPGGREEFLLPDDATGVYFRARPGVATIPPTSADIPVSYACR